MYLVGSLVVVAVKMVMMITVTVEGVVLIIDDDVDNVDYCSGGKVDRYTELVHWLL